MTALFQRLMLVSMGLCLAAPAMAQTLRVEGSDGTRVLVDGEPVATLPMTTSVPIAAGYHFIQCELPGHVRFEDTLSVAADQDLELIVDLLPMRRREAVGYSLLLAGTGHQYLGQSGRGWTLLGLQLSAATDAIVADIVMKDRREDHVEALEAYHAAFDEAEITARRQEAEEAFSSMESALTWRRVAIGSAVGVAVLAAVDAWFQFDRVVVASPEISIGDRGEEVRLAWSIDF